LTEPPAEPRLVAPGRPSIRLLIQLLIALLLTSTIAVTGYAVVVQSKARPAEAKPAAVIEPLPTLPEPRRPARRPSFVPASASGPTNALRPAQGTLVIEVVRGADGIPDDLLETAGVAVIDAELDSIVSWIPLRSGLEQEDRVVLQANAPKSKLRLALAASEATARRGAWYVHEVQTLEPSQPIRLTPRLHRIELQATTEPSGLNTALQLRREGDPQWLPLAAFLHGHGLAPEGSTELLLSAGRYKLQPLGEGWNELTFDVPGSKSLQAHFTRQR
jgi:hypothetical protein